MMKVSSCLVLWLVCCLSTTTATNFFQSSSPWGWSCDTTGVCVKKDAGGTEPLITLNTCKLTCGANGVLWPRPSQAIVGNDITTFLPTNITNSVTCGSDPVVCDLLNQTIVIFKDNIQRYHPEYDNDGVLWEGPFCPNTLSQSLHLDITLGGSESNLGLETDESYELYVSTANSVITGTIIAPTFFGARHALETLSQLIEYHENEGSLMMVTMATVTDAPAFKYRGLMLDTSRNFISMETLQRTLDAMASTKLNTFHLHLTDSHSFPLYFPDMPNMAYYGAYSSNQFYTPENLRSLQDYARVRGVRLLPEFDAPAHVGSGFEWGPKEGLGNLLVCVNQEPWQSFCLQPPCGQLNLANPNMYTVLGQIYTEFLKIFNPVDIFHYGGDEVNLDCWNSTKEITDWMTANNNSLSDDGYYEQWGVFQDKARQLLKTAAKSSGQTEPFGMIWNSHLTEPGRLEKYLDPRVYGVQLWRTKEDQVFAQILKSGYKVVFSNYDAWFLDCGSGAWVGEGNNWCSPYKGWQTVYNNSPHEIATQLTGSPYIESIMGGEAVLWTEQIDDMTVDAKMWPRGAALGERLWTNPTTGWYEAESRFIHHRQRMVSRGIKADRIQPQWCHQNEKLCYITDV